MDDSGTSGTQAARGLIAVIKGLLTRERVELAAAQVAYRVRVPLKGV